MAAIQYVFLKNVPDSVSTFAFVFITNLIGLVILCAVKPKRLLKIKKTTLIKGLILAIELTGFNVFMLLGSRHLDAVIISSVVSLYFVFITPILLILKKKVNLFSGIATFIAIIALLLMFGADLELLVSSPDVIYLLISDIFFAAYVVSVSIMGEGEDSITLIMSQMSFAALFSIIGWLIEGLITGKGFELPTQPSFWISAVFIGVFIRAVYGLIQISCQKKVSALKTSLIFSTEIIITLITNPIMCAIFDVEATPISLFQIVGSVLLIISILMVDDSVTKKIGYSDIVDTETDEDSMHKSSVARKMILTTLSFAILTLILSIIIFLSAIHYIKNNAVENSEELGISASSVSSEAMMDKLEESMLGQVEDKALLAEQKLSAYSDSILYAASYAESLLKNPDSYPDKEVEPPKSENAGLWKMMRNLASKEINYDSVRNLSCLLGNMEDVFTPIVNYNVNITTIYIGTENGLFISYDPYSDSGSEIGEGYFEYRSRPWYEKSKEIEGYGFTDTYQDDYGRGLTITCFAPFRDPSGNFFGCVAMDILMKELNSSMVNDGIIDPSYATLIDNQGNYIAGKNVDVLSDDMGNIFDEGKDAILCDVGHQILERKNGVVSQGEGDDALYVAFATIDSTDWTLCILSPVYTVIKPALTIRENIDNNTKNVVDSVKEGILNVIQSCLMLSAFILLFVTLFAGRISKKISDPLKRLEADVRKISNGNLDIRTSVTTDDEIGSLAGSFNSMTDSLQKYIADLKEVTAKEERIASELAVATNIQASMLPRDFDDFSSRKEFNLFATMTPAKEVGGDFYDFFMIDEDHIALVMADVSGKGIPAALFMAISKALIKNSVLAGNGPADALYKANEQLCEGNDAELFVTVWLAVIELSTGKGIAVNAGHEHPVLKRADGKYELVEYKHSIAVAAMEGVGFREHEFELHPGDTVFVYTDGVPEATNANNELYGTERMLNALNKRTNESPEELLELVRKDIDSFVDKAPQFDDLTMLCFDYMRP
ncbi:MAG: SpoIIE family protein phosphatase [Lachnospiraceae bacterium]|nr:SpoIIE family protein phosphatase [Lachnospiraceae bacterium]